MLRVELEAAEKQVRQATSEEKATAQERFKQALRRFTRLVTDGELPEELRWE